MANIKIVHTIRHYEGTMHPGIKFLTPKENRAPTTALGTFERSNKGALNCLGKVMLRTILRSWELREADGL